MLEYLLLSVFLVFQSGSVRHASERQAPFLEDAEILVEALKERHPNPFGRVSEEEFRTSLEAIANDIDELDQFGLALRPRQAVATLGDTHTAVEFDPSLGEAGRLPLEFAWFADGLYIIGASEEYAHLRGRRLGAIKGKPIDAIL